MLFLLLLLAWKRCPSPGCSKKLHDFSEPPSFITTTSWWWQINGGPYDTHAQYPAQHSDNGLTLSTGSTCILGQHISASRRGQRIWRNVLISTHAEHCGLLFGRINQMGPNKIRSGRKNMWPNFSRFVQKGPRRGWTCKNFVFHFSLTQGKSKNLLR